MEIFAQASQFAGTEPTVKAKSLLALSVVQMPLRSKSNLASIVGESSSFPLLIPIMICSVLYLAPDPR